MKAIWVPDISPTSQYSKAFGTSILSTILPTVLDQGIRKERVETVVLSLYTNCHSVSSLPILLQWLPILKITVLPDLKNICLIIEKRVLLLGIALYLIEP